MQQLPDFEKTDSRRKKTFLELTKYHSRKKKSVNYQTDTDKLSIVVYRYRNNIYPNDSVIDLRKQNERSFFQNKYIA